MAMRTYVMSMVSLINLLFLVLYSSEFKILLVFLFKSILFFAIIVTILIFRLTSHRVNLLMEK